ncbi:MAG: DUF4381 domain-containing protein [Geminicoccaceae bacterium]
MNGDDSEQSAAGPADADGGTAAENLLDLVDALIEPAEPAPIPMTPQTWGWAALAVLAALLLAWLLWRWIAWRRANAYRRAALAAVRQAETAADIARILRRTALAAYPRDQVAGLIGPAWISFLERSGRGGFATTAGAELRATPYKDETLAPSPELRAAAEAWVRTHGRTPGPGAPAAKPRLAA